MSCPIYCPACDAFQGDVGLTASGDATCTDCGGTFDLAGQTLADG